jgi:UDP-2-acetamido-3-amino-2,3-dideoxy-glucuronate N-acetyltransferase
MTMPSVDDINVDDLPCYRDPRGNLVVAEFSKCVPFHVVRLFYVHDVPANTIRGQHAHRYCRQYLICQSGRVLVDARDARRTRQVQLNAGQAVLIESGIFYSETYLDRDAMLLVLCDRTYDRGDYIDSLEEFIAVFPAS